MNLLNSVLLGNPNISSPLYFITRKQINSKSFNPEILDFNSIVSINSYKQYFSMIFTVIIDMIVTFNIYTTRSH